MEDDTRDNRLGEYLRARRDVVTPDQLGLPSTTGRRVSGLRREEVAMLAGISGDYYLRLERGRDANPSTQVLTALARVLQLDDVETDYLMSLRASVPHPPRRRRQFRIAPRVHQLLDVVQAPAFIETPYFDILAQNSLAQALSPRLVGGRNRILDLFLDTEERAFQQDWAGSLAASVASFRRSIGDHVDDARVVEIVGELSLASARFRQLWARHDVRQLQGESTTVTHPIIGDMRLHREKLLLADVILVVYYPEANSAAADKLALLATLDAPSPDTSYASE